MREGYLETIDNLVQTDPAVIAMSQNNTQSSTRYIKSRLMVVPVTFAWSGQVRGEENIDSTYMLHFAASNR